jgi:hypothetical protein
VNTSAEPVDGERDGVGRCLVVHGQHARGGV